jgi:hypothetical protein
MRVEDVWKRIKKASRDETSRTADVEIEESLWHPVRATFDQFHLLLDAKQAL